ncbi:MAG: FtsX-like permease family protein [Cyclobacteriaceae bacterium]|nr:FtsX-like permease family protein [Cyclobacteriaceae bacterium]
MFKNLIKTAFRTIKREKGYSLINVLGLTIGISSGIFLLLYVLDELSYDRYHHKGEDIYRVITTITEVDNEFTWVVAQIPFGPTVKEKYPEVEEYVRFIGMGKVLFKKDELKFYDDEIYATDSAVFDVFTYRFLTGNPKTALYEPHTMVLTRELAIRYFGDIDVLGKTVETQGQVYKVTGVIENVPKNSHFTFNGLVSVNSLSEERRTGNWGNFGVFTYLYTPNLSDPAHFEAKLSGIYDEYCAPIFNQYGVNFKYKLQQLPDIHLHSHYDGDTDARGDIKYVYIFSVVALFMLIIASINYMNLATARSAKRSREVGIRKVMGSHRIQLIGQFILESLVLTVCSFLLSMVLVLALLPFFNDLLEKSITMAWLGNPMLIFGLLGIVVFVGVLGGSYPAFYLSSFQPTRVLKGKGASRGGNAFLRKGLVILQFSISITMIVCTWLVYDQLQFMRQKDLGFDKSICSGFPCLLMR